jgi:aromatic-L-amino-acid decarboxylase
MNWQTSPACTEVEDVMMEWLRSMLGLPEEFSGVIQDTASTATLCALLCARERATGHSQEGAGFAAQPAPLVVYASDQAHSSILKATMLSGMGRDNLRLVETDAEHAMAPDALATAVEQDLAAGRTPCAVVATVGTTATTAIDPLADIARIALERGLWLHVWAGVETADSLVLNPHKWLGTGFDLSAYYIRDADHLVRTMGTDPSYLRTARDGSVRNLRDWGIPLGRRFRALKLWFVIRDQGVEGLQRRIRRDMANARRLGELVDAAADWERLAPVPLQTVCLRHVPEALRDDEQALAIHNLTIADAVNAGGRYCVTPSVVKGVQLIRVSVGALPTELEHVEGAWAALQQAADGVGGSPGRRP